MRRFSWAAPSWRGRSQAPTRPRGLSFSSAPPTRDRTTAGSHRLKPCGAARGRRSITRGRSPPLRPFSKPIRPMSRGALALVRAHERGEGVPRDAARAMAFYGRAAKLGSTAAMGLLRSAYAEGTGVARDPSIAELMALSDHGGGRCAAWKLASLASGAPVDRRRSLPTTNTCGGAARLVEGHGRDRPPSARGIGPRAGHGGRPRMDAARRCGQRRRESRAGAPLEHGRRDAEGHCRGARSPEQRRASRARFGDASARSHAVAAGCAEYDRGAALQWLEKAVAAGQDLALRDLQRLRGTGKAK